MKWRGWVVIGVQGEQVVERKVVERKGEEGKGEEGGEEKVRSLELNAVELKEWQLRMFEWQMTAGSIGTDDILILAIFITPPKMNIIVSVSLSLNSSAILTSLLPKETLFDMLLEGNKQTIVWIWDDM